VYQHINKINGKRYIGITSQSPASLRWGSNGKNYSVKTRFGAAILKYGWDTFEHLIVAESLTRTEAEALEIKLIAEYKTQDKQFGYNLLEGGNAPTITKEIRQKMSKAMTGNKNGLGKVCSEEKKRKIREAQLGKIVPLEVRQKQSESAKRRGGHSFTEEQKKKISDSHKKKPVYCVELDNYYESIQACGKALGIPATCICAVVRGKHKSTGGLHFIYKEDDK
jgi:group I intron endonuclease